MLFPSRNSHSTSAALAESAPSFSGRGTHMAQGSSTCKMGTMEAGRPRSQAPRRCEAPRPRTAPPRAAMPMLPATTSTWPRVPLCVLRGYWGKKSCGFAKSSVRPLAFEVFQECFGRADADIRRENLAAFVQSVVQIVAGLGALEGRESYRPARNAENACPERPERPEGMSTETIFAPWLNWVAVHALDERGGVSRRGA